jgi:hypothetical protein
MAVEESVKRRLNHLATESIVLRIGNSNGYAQNDAQRQKCSGWLVSALNLIQVICPSQSNPFRKKAELIVARDSGASINQDVGEFGALLENLGHDIEAGLLTSIADKARAETFDEFLDHGRAYLEEKRKQEAGVICGVVFEDTVRGVCRKHQIVEAGVKLDALITALTKIDVLTGPRLNALA